MAAAASENGDVETLEEGTDEVRRPPKGEDTGLASMVMGEYQVRLLASFR